MAEKMNIYQKLQKCRVELQKSGLKKSGRNTFSNYDFFELGDFLPRTNELFAEHGLIGLVSPGETSATLTIRDTDKPEDIIVFSCPNAEITLKGAHAIQNIGAVKTYQRRYLWIDAMEISEHDAVDSSEGNKESEDKMVELTFEDVSKQKMGFGKIVDETKIATIRGLLAKTDSSESEFLKFYKLERLEDMTIDTFTRAMKALEKKLEKIQKTDFTGTPFEELPI
jgi:hypothetical protein